MKKAFIILAFILSTFTTKIFAQASLSMNDSTTLLSSSDTLSNGGNLVYTGVIFNESVQTYNSNIWVALAVDTMGTQGVDTANFIYLAWQNVAGGAVITLAPGDSVSFVDTIVIGGQFRNGINTVVIWPIANMSGFNYGSSKDSAHIEVFVFDPLSIKSEEAMDQLILYPNPFSEKVWFLTKGNIILEEVRILDALGRTIFIEKNPGKQYIETGSLLQGVYFIELTYANGEKKRIKTMKQ